MIWLYAYINLNPVLDKITDNPKKYKWSSYYEIVSWCNDLCDLNFLKKEFKESAEVMKFFKDALPVLKINKELRRLRFE